MDFSSRRRLGDRGIEPGGTAIGDQVGHRSVDRQRGQSESKIAAVTLSPGTRLGAYEIVAPLGAGGMGEVYKARDPRLNRFLAIKVLPISRLDDPAARTRFQREAQTLAGLNNPHIAAIHDVIDVDDHRAIVMELIAGPTLAEVIARGPVPRRVAIGYAIDICDALSVAHAAGIVHRDLKPANVAITDTGSAKVLDFGIAKLGVANDAMEGEPSTMTAVTQDGRVVGTLGYVSPEQAQGQSLDGRSDIFSLGVVLHELFSGRRAFHGDSAAALLSAVLRDDPPPLRTLVPAMPRGIERCVTRCLEKDPRRRYQSAADLKAALDDLREDLGVPAAVSAVNAPAPTPATRARRALVLAAILVVALISGFFAAGVLQPAVILSPNYRPLITEAVSVGNPVWSPDGRTLAYVAAVNSQLQIFLRGIDAAQSTLVNKQGTDGISIFWSPDGSRIYFTRASDGSLMSVSAGGGEPQLVTTVAPPDVKNPVRPPGGLKASISPDGHTIVFTRGEPGGVRLWTLDVRTGDNRPLDPSGLPRPLANVQALAFSPDGTKVALIGSATALNDARGVWLMSWPGGPARQLFADAPYLASNPSISWLPDSRRFVINGYPLHGGANRLLMATIASGMLSPLTGGKDDEGSPSVSPDGSRIAFVSRRSGLDLIQIPIDGGSPEPFLATSRSESHPDISVSGVFAYVTNANGSPEVRIRSGADTWPRTIGGMSGPERDRATQPYEARVSPDGQRLAINTYAAEHLIWIYPTAGGTPVRLDSDTTDQHGPSWSPDGNWIAYHRLRTGSWEIVKAPLGGGAVMRLDDADPGGGPTDWSSTGQWIAHERPDGMYLVAPDGSATRVLAGLRSSAFRFSHDASRLVAVRRGAARQWELTVWDVAAGRELRSIPLPLASTADVAGMALSPDDSHVILGAGTATSDIWLLEQFEPPALWAALSLRH